MSDYMDLASEIHSLPSNTAFCLAPQAQRTIVEALRMVETVDSMLAYLGYNGEISAKDERVLAVMDCLKRIDPQ